MSPERKHPRLEMGLYAYACPPCSLTITVRKRREVFGYECDEFTRKAISIFAVLATKHNVPVHISLFMPDHVHLCVEAAPGYSILDLVREMKNLITRQSWQHGHRGSFWQKSFFDHFLRKDEGIEKVVAYILNNPIRAGITTKLLEYPYWYSNKYSECDLANL